MRSRNVGRCDAGIRVFAGLALLVLSGIIQDRPLVALGIGFIAAILLGTALMRVCPLYTLFRINTAPHPKAV